MKLWKAMVRTALVGLLLVVAAPSPRAHATVQFSLAPVLMSPSGGMFSIDFLVTSFTFGVASSTTNPADIQINGGQYIDSSSIVLNDFSTSLPPVNIIGDSLDWNGSTLTPSSKFAFFFFDGGRRFSIFDTNLSCENGVESCAAGAPIDTPTSYPISSYVPSVPTAAGAPEPPGWGLLAVGVALVGWICQMRARRN